MNTLNEINIRKSMDSPPFFKKIGKIGRIFTVIGGSITVLAVSLASGGLAIPAIIPTIGVILGSVGEAVKQVSTLAVEDKAALNEALKTDI
jgi:hypothetical protein